MSGTAKEWGTLAELCLVLAGIPLAVMAPQVLWQVFGERRATGPLTLLAQFLATCVVLVVLMLVDTLVDAAFLALTRNTVATQIVWVPWSVGLVLASAASALLVLLFSKLTTERYKGLLERDG